MEVLVETTLFILFSLLLYFVLTLFYIHYRNKNKEQKKQQINEIIEDIINEYYVNKNNTIDDYKILKTNLGLKTIIKNLDGMKKKYAKIFKKIIIESDYKNFISTSLKVGEHDQLIFNIKLAGELQIKEFKDDIKKALYSKEDIYLQYNALLALSKLGETKELIDYIKKHKILFTENVDCQPFFVQKL